MNRAYCIILIVALWFNLGGCATMAKLDGSTEEEIKKFRMSKDQLWIELEMLKAKNQDLQNRLNILEGEHERTKVLEKRIGTLHEQLESKRAEMSELERKVSALEAEKSEFEREISGLEKEKRALEKRLWDLALGKDVGTLKIKVLSGDGDIQSAKQMAERLIKLGYRIKAIGLAPRKTFESHTVFFAPNFERDANRIVSQLGGGTISKPLNWPSAFNCIVVTGKSP